MDIEQPAITNTGLTSSADKQSVKQKKKTPVVQLTVTKPVAVVAVN